MDNDRVTTCWNDPALAPFLRGARDLVRVLTGPVWHHGRVGASDASARLIERACVSATEAPVTARRGANTAECDERATADSRGRRCGAPPSALFPAPPTARVALSETVSTISNHGAAGQAADETLPPSEAGRLTTADDLLLYVPDVGSSRSGAVARASLHAHDAGQSLLPEEIARVWASPT